MFKFHSDFLGNGNHESIKKRHAFLLLEKIDEKKIENSTTKINYEHDSEYEELEYVDEEVVNYKRKLRSRRSRNNGTKVNYKE